MQHASGSEAVVSLRKHFFGEAERTVLRVGQLEASLFRYDTGIEAVRLRNARGSVVVLPYMGQIVWSATFDGVELAMASMFQAPRPAGTIIETYGCLAYHAGVLRNGVPTAEDSHAVHGEMPVAPMDEAGLACGTDERGAWIAVTSRRDYAMGFGAHYLATPRVVLRADAALLDIVMEVQNLSGAPMDLMYLCHANFAFAEGARIVQPVPFTPDDVVARTALPGHVVASDAYRAMLADVAQNPGRMEVLNEPERYNPEQVFYVRNVAPGPDGLAHFMLARTEGDAFTIAYDPVAMPHTIRWILVNSDQRVAAFAMPATCEPEGYSAEKRKGNVRSLAGGARVAFTTRLGYVDREHTAEAARAIEGSRGERSGR